MVAWLKFYFLSFFSNRISKEGATRSIVNFIFSFILALAIMCGGMIAGYAASFNRHYNNCPAFAEFMYSAFTDGEEITELKTDGGKLSVSLPGEREYIDGFKESDSDYNKNGYTLVIDTRAVDENGTKPDYSEYAYKGDKRNYLILLSDAVFCSFTASNGIEIRFVGDYSKVGNGQIVSSGSLSADNRNIVDLFIKQIFDSSIEIEFLVYIISMFRWAVVYLLATFALALIVYLAVKFSKSELCGTYTEALKTVGSYLFVSSLLSFIIALILPFFISHGLTFALSSVALFVILLVRTAILLIPSIIKDRKKSNENAIGGLDI